MTKYTNVFDRRASRVRRKIKKVSSGLPRLSVYRSNQHIYVQLIDDLHGSTLVSVNSLNEDFKGAKCNIELASSLGRKIGELSVKKGVNKAVFDKSGYRYHGKVKAVADGAREAGLTI